MSTYSLHLLYDSNEIPHSTSLCSSVFTLSYNACKSVILSLTTFRQSMQEAVEFWKGAQLHDPRSRQGSHLHIHQRGLLGSMLEWGEALNSHHFKTVIYNCFTLTRKVFQFVHKNLLSFFHFMCAHCDLCLRICSAQRTHTYRKTERKMAWHNKEIPCQINNLSNKRSC